MGNQKAVRLKHKGVDFKKVRSKVGRKLPPPSNETKTTVKAKTIVLPGQKLLDDRSQAAVSQRGHTLPELLAQSGHYSDKVRQESLVRLRELLAANPDELRRHAGTILAKLAPRIADVDKKTRDSLLLLMRNVLFPTMQPEERMAPFFTLLMGHVGCAMTHVAPDIRHAALPFLSALLAHYPSLFRSSSTAQVVAHFSDMLALASPSARSFPALATTLAALTSFLSTAFPHTSSSSSPASSSPTVPSPSPLTASPSLIPPGSALPLPTSPFTHPLPTLSAPFPPATTASAPSPPSACVPPVEYSWRLGVRLQRAPLLSALSNGGNESGYQALSASKETKAAIGPGGQQAAAATGTAAAEGGMEGLSRPAGIAAALIPPVLAAVTECLPLVSAPSPHLPALACLHSALSALHSLLSLHPPSPATLLSSSTPLPSSSSFPSSPSPGFAPTHSAGCQSFSSIFPHMPEAAAGAALPAQQHQSQPHQHQNHQQQQQQQQQGGYGDALSRVLHKLGTAFPLHAPAGLAAARAKGTKGSNGTAGGAAAAGGGQQREVGEQLALLNVLLAECLSLFLPASAAAAAAAAAADGSGAAGAGGRGMGKRRRGVQGEGGKGTLGAGGGDVRGERGTGRGAVRGDARRRLLEGSRFVIRMSGGSKEWGGKGGGGGGNEGSKRKNGVRESERGRGDTGDVEEAEEGGDEEGEEAEEEEEEEEAREEAWVGQLYEFIEGAMEGKLLPAPTAAPILSRHVSESLIRRLLPLLPTLLHYAPSAARHASLLGGFSRLFSVSPARSATRAACLDVMFGLLQQQATVLRLFFRIASISPQSPPSPSSSAPPSSSSLSEHISSVQPLLVPFFAASIAARPAAPATPAPSPAAAAPAVETAAAEEAAAGHRLVVGPFLLLPAPLQALSLDLLLCFPHLSLPLLQSLAVCCIASHSLHSHLSESQTQQEQQQHKGQGTEQDASEAAALLPRGMRWLAGRAVEVVGAAHRRGAVGLPEYLGFLVSLLLSRTRAHSHPDITTAFQGRVRRHEEAERQHHQRHSHTHAGQADPKGELKSSPPSDLPRSKSAGSRRFLEDSSGLCREIWEREPAVGAVCAALVHVPVGGGVGGAVGGSVGNGGGVGGQAGALMDGAAVLDLVSQPLAAALVSACLLPARPPHPLPAHPVAPETCIPLPTPAHPCHPWHLPCCHCLLPTVSLPRVPPSPPSLPPQSDPSTSPPCLYGIFRAVAACSRRAHLHPFPAPLGVMPGVAEVGSGAGGGGLEGDQGKGAAPVEAADPSVSATAAAATAGGIEECEGSAQPSAQPSPLSLACAPTQAPGSMSRQATTCVPPCLSALLPASLARFCCHLLQEHLSSLSTSTPSPAPTRTSLLRACPWLVPALRLLALHPFLLAPFLHLLLLRTEKQERGAWAVAGKAGSAGAGSTGAEGEGASVQARAGVVCVAVLWGPLEQPLLLLGVADRQQLIAGLAGLTQAVQAAAGGGSSVGWCEALLSQARSRLALLYGCC
ncbi:unnamed protein product [Closterium sp. Naga37s-1]|nr:unnamed protein product [Closterium sp. Naga37s-1]